MVVMFSTFNFLRIAEGNFPLRLLNIVMCFCQRLQANKIAYFRHQNLLSKIVGLKLTRMIFLARNSADQF